ncbi:hypothetical protein D6789_01335 [Candidatus Woesearchaeota archaeon]|nr:MAG: hypothetical protein D6789_01335 [Candidatus Woesearchaeota archaeon]
MPDEAVPRTTASYDSRREWRADPKGYFLIKVFYARGEIGVRHMNYRHEAQEDILGKDALSIAQTCVRKGLLSSLQHAAYLGHELHKAETALKLGLVFIQDEPLDFNKKASEPESENVKR